MHFLIILTIMAQGLLANATQIIEPSSLFERGNELSSTLKTANPSKIETLNNMGAMFIPFNPLTVEFIADVKAHPHAYVVEFGGAFGNVARKCLENGAQNYTLNDLNLDHLAVFSYQLQQEGRNAQFPNVTLLHGDFTEDKRIKPGSVQFGIINNTIHFLNPNQFKAGIDKITEITAVGGVWYITTLNIDCKWYQGDVDVIGVKVMYQARKEGSAKQDFPETFFSKDFPGIFCMDANQYLSLATRQYLARVGISAPQQLFLADKDKLKEYVIRKGFVVEKLETYSLPDQMEPWKEGTDIIGLKIRKI